MKITTSGIINSLAENVELSNGVKATVIDSSQGPVTFTLKRDSSLEYKAKFIDSIKKKLTFILDEPGASIKVKCVVYGSGDNVYNISTLQHHKAPDTKSDLEIKGVFFDNSSLLANNLIRIDKDAQRVVANEQNKNLLLSDGARVTTIPKLEVEADDVSAQHGAAISRLNNEQLFYLQSRGIDLTAAKKFLIDAFLNI